MSDENVAQLKRQQDHRPRPTANVTQASPHLTCDSLANI